MASSVPAGDDPDRRAHTWSQRRQGRPCIWDRRPSASEGWPKRLASLMRGEVLILHILNVLCFFFAWGLHGLFLSLHM